MALDIAVQLWPHVEWTGGSAIHASRYASWDASANSAEQLIQQSTSNQWAQQVYTFLVDLFDNFEWLLSKEDFEALMNADLYRYAQNGSTTKTPHMLTNPVTGNQFHLIARINEVVGGIRFWADKGWGGSYNVGFRFRIEMTEEEEVLTRERLRLAVEEAVLEFESLTVSGSVMVALENVEKISGIQGVKMGNKAKVLVSVDQGAKAEVATAGQAEESSPDIGASMAAFFKGESL